MADQEFPEGTPFPKVITLVFFAKNCMEMKQFGPRGRIPGAVLDPPVLTVGTVGNL